MHFQVAPFRPGYTKGLRAHSARQKVTKTSLRDRSLSINMSCSSLATVKFVTFFINFSKKTSRGDFSETFRGGFSSIKMCSKRYCLDLKETPLRVNAATGLEILRRANFTFKTQRSQKNRTLTFTEQGSPEYGPLSA